MSTETYIAVFFVLILISFLLPYWVMWTVFVLFGIDWHAKYWAVWSLGVLITWYFKNNFNFKKE